MNRTPSSKSSRSLGEADKYTKDYNAEVTKAAPDTCVRACPPRRNHTGEDRGGFPEDDG